MTAVFYLFCISHFAVVEQRSQQATHWKKPLHPYVQIVACFLVTCGGTFVEECVQVEPVLWSGFVLIGE